MDFLQSKRTFTIIKFAEHYQTVEFDPDDTFLDTWPSVAIFIACPK
ncbi:hypothetical protein N5J23_17575 [Comamonas aquatica]|uniref:Uncharacterized protein n=1 Tax=Comamonas aquatica TaxID=225991 RepID=A0AA43AYE2_9BURK|nr:hypothetical protein [Comamonas aquatica]MDH1428866.1 hypothetical protein [Comamonas aquatica]MDH1607597.1 hypothetical protein [Comamonas aquatica]MDH1619345.1 hypothetical protein [Comamonas aquatica]MDH2007317.1 hypothetical protein [Comamonas aquatica]